MGDDGLEDGVGLGEEEGGSCRKKEDDYQALDPSSVVICVHFCGVLFCLSYGA